MHVAKKLIVILLFTLITGCASKPKQELVITSNQNSPLWLQHQNKVKKISHWQAKGRVAASKAGEGGNASFVWNHEPNFFKIHMFGPFGAGSAELTGNDQRVMFEQADGKKMLAPNPEEVLYHNTGLFIPVSGLSHWIKGIPSPLMSVDHFGVNQYGQLAYLVQSGWRIQFQKYQQINTLSLPEKIQLERGDVRVKLVIKRWSTS